MCKISALFAKQNSSESHVSPTRRTSGGYLLQVPANFYSAACAGNGEHAERLRERLAISKSEIEDPNREGIEPESISLMIAFFLIA